MYTLQLTVSVWSFTVPDWSNLHNAGPAQL